MVDYYDRITQQSMDQTLKVCGTEVMVGGLGFWMDISIVASTSYFDKLTILPGHSFTFTICYSHWL